jgi:hypothetical protein
VAAPERDQVDPFAHEGPWSEADVLALPVERHIELLDGSLLVSPTSSHRHQWLSSRLWAALNAEAAHGVRALEAVNVRVAIPSYLRIELEDDAPVGHLHELDRGAYCEVAGGPTITLTEPR